MTGQSESFIAHNLFYHNQQSTSNQTCLMLLGVNSISIEDNQFENFNPGASPTTTGISVGPATGYPVPASYQIKIKGNLFAANSSFYTQGIILNPGVAQIWVGGNRFGPNVATAITDNSAVPPGQQTAPGRHYITVKLSVSQGIPSGIDTPVLWDTVQYQTLGWTFTPPASAITIPANQPYLAVRCTAGVEFASNGTGRRIMKFLHNGSIGPGLPVQSTPAITIPSNATDLSAVTSIFAVQGGDTISLLVGQDSGGALGLDVQVTWMSCEAIE
jgi:hypothetical protein